MITSFANPRVAQAFVDYMATQGIILTIQQHTQSDIWLADESRPDAYRPSWPAFWKIPPIRVTSPPAGSRGTPIAGCTTSAFPFSDASP